MTPEFRTRVILRWALDETPLKYPAKLERPASWRWNDDDQQLFAMTDKGEYKFHVALTVGRIKIPHAVMSVYDYDGRATWEADVPPDVYHAADL